jgi:DNA-binding transcriptional MerR regulator
MDRGLKARLRGWLGRDDLTLEELVEAASSLVASVAPKQTRYKVQERPDARTVRYYVSQKLLPAPVSYDEGRARYSGRHLLRLLTIKRLQAEHHTLKRIAAVLGKTSDDELLEELKAAAGPLELSGATAPRLEDHVSAKNEPADGMLRLELEPGGSVEVPEAVLKDSRRRRRLARNLRSLARWLELSQSEEPNEGGRS